MLHTVRSLAFLALIFTPLTTLAGGLVTTTKVPVKVNIDPQALAAMNEDDREAVEAVREQIEKNVWTYDAFEIEAPETIFAEAPIVRLADFKQPTDREIQDLALNGDGSPKRLSPEQIESIRDTGLLIIPSKLFPGKNHVWKVALWLQKGRENIQIDLQQAKADALGQLVVQIPDRFVSEDPISARHGVVSVWKGLSGTFKLLIGAIEKRPRYNDAEMSALIREQVKGDARKDLGESFDGRLYDEDLMEKVEERVAAIVRDFDKNWPGFQEEVVPGMIEILAHQVSPEQIAAIVKRKLALHRIQLFHSLLKEDKELEALSSGIGRLLVNRDQALRMSMETETQISQDVTDFAEQAGKKIDAEYPMRSKIPAWREKYVKIAVDAQVPEIREKRFKELIKAMRGENLSQETDLLEKSVQYFKDRAEGLRTEMGKDLVASRIIEIRNRIFFAKNWMKGVSYDKDGGKTYYPIKYETVNVTSRPVGWRLNLAAQRIRMMLKNWNYHMIVSNLINGPVGFKALVYKQDFAPFMTMDEKTGELKVDQSVKWSPLIARHRAIWNWVKASKERFENQPQRGFISKETLRPFYNGVANIKGAALTAGLWILQPTFTVANTILTTGLVGTSAAWAPISGALWWAFDATLFDTAKPASNDPVKLPLVQRLVFQGGLGLIEAVGSSIGGTLGHLGTSGTYWVAGQARAKGRTAWDSLMNLIFIKRANLPAGDSMTIKRVSGPNIASQYMFQIPPDLVVVALQAHLESLELYAFEQWTKEMINESEIALNSYIKATVGQLGLQVSDKAEWAKQVEARANEIREQLNEVVKLERLKRPQTLPREIEGRVRLKQADLDHLLKIATPVVQKFWIDHIRHLISAKESAYWQGKALVQDDYAGLTKRMLQDIFGKEILTSLEKTDDNFIVNVDSPDYSRLLSNILDGEPVEPSKIVEEQINVPAMATRLNTEITFASVLPRTLDREPCEMLMHRF